MTKSLLCLLLIATCYFTLSWGAISVDKIVNDYRTTIAKADAIRRRRDNTTCGNSWFPEEHRLAVRRAIHDLAHWVDVAENAIGSVVHTVQVWAQPITKAVSHHVNKAVDWLIGAYHAVKEKVVQFGEMIADGYNYLKHQAITFYDGYVAPAIQFFKKLWVESGAAHAAKVMFKIAVHVKNAVVPVLKPIADEVVKKVSEGLGIAKDAVVKVVEGGYNAVKDGVVMVGLEIEKVGEKVYVHMKPYVDPVINCVEGYMLAIGKETETVHKGLMADFQTYNQTMEFMAQVLGNPTDQADEMTPEEKFIQMDKVRQILEDVATDFGDGSSLRI